MADYILRALAVSYPSGHRLESHAHDWGQLIYAASGTMQVTTGDRLWLVPPTRALWAPAGMPHAIEMRGTVAMRTIYVPPAQALPKNCRAMEIAPLLREVILHIVGLRLLRAREPAHLHLAQVFLDLIAAAKSLPLYVPMPGDARAAQVARMLDDDPARGDGIAALARAVGMSTRTLQRVFREETGLRFVEWRQRLRLQRAIARLELGASVTEAGADAGYASTSAFIAAFRAQIGTTPARYARTRT